MDIFYNKEAFKLFLGAVLTIVFIVMVRYISSRKTYIGKRKEILDEIEGNSEKQAEYGNVDEYLKNRKVTTLNVGDEIMENIIHPLTVVILINLFDEHTTFSSVITLVVFLFSIYHEMLGAEDNGKNCWYRFFIVALWVLTYFAITYQYNINNMVSHG